MPDLDRGVVSWTGSGVTGAAFTVMYATPGGSFMSAIRTFFDSVKSYIPTSVTLHFPSTGDTIDSATGALVGGWSGTTLTDVVGFGAANAPKPAGLCVAWATNTIAPAHDGKPPRKVRGRTFVVPLSSESYQTDGTLVDAVRTLFNTSATNLITTGAGHFQIWHRPTTPGGTNGLAAPVISASIKDKAAILTSRRD